jgi:hypothetical protein
MENMGMEHPETTVSALALVNQREVLYFCQAVQAYADRTGAHEEAARALRVLRARLDTLQNLASLCRLAIVGDAYSLARVTDELYCLSVDYPADPLESLPGEAEPHEDELDERVVLGPAIDLFAGAAFASKDKPEQRDRFVIGIVRAIEVAIAFPVTFSAEAATQVGHGDGTVQPLHARLVIANATQRVIDGDLACVPRVPLEIRRRLYCLARMWMQDNPVDEFFAAVAGPKVREIVHWEDPARDQPDDARVGDPVTLLLEHGATTDTCCGAPADHVVMFCPHAPAPVVRVVRGGLEVRVPEHSRTGPIAVLVKSPDFAPVKALIARYSNCFPVEWSTSIFAVVRMDVWAFPTAFCSTGRGPPSPVSRPRAPTGHRCTSIPRADRRSRRRR